MELPISGNVIFKHINLPACEKCEQSAELFRENKMKFATIVADKKLFGDLMKLTKSQNIPQIFVNGEYIGGYEDLEKWIVTSENE
jgi:glutaredoxin